MSLNLSSAAVVIGALRVNSLKTIVFRVIFDSKLITSLVSSVCLLCLKLAACVP